MFSAHKAENAVITVPNIAAASLKIKFRKIKESVRNDPVNGIDPAGVSKITRAMQQASELTDESRYFPGEKIDDIITPNRIDSKNVIGEIHIRVPAVIFGRARQPTRRRGGGNVSKRAA